MPYIPQADRKELDGQARFATNPGELTYQISRLVAAYWRQHPHKFQTIAEILGSLSASESEFYRRVVLPYENAKLAQNGDVYSD